MKGAMMLVFHTAGVPYKPAGKGSCIDPVFTKVPVSPQPRAPPSLRRATSASRLERAKMVCCACLPAFVRAANTHTWLHARRDARIRALAM